ncbi:MAG: hypothetical protein WCW68_11140 [Methanothrix sp.]
MPAVEQDGRLPGGQLEGLSQYLHVDDQDDEYLEEQGDGRMEFDFNDRLWVTSGI